MRRPTAAVGILFVLLPLLSRSHAFVAPCGVAAARIVCPPAAAAAEPNNSNNNNAENDENENQQPSTGLSQRSSSRLSDAQQSHERAMEALSAQGSARIAQLSIAERTKRAMLAEAVEDQIFENTEQLEELLTNRGNNISSSSSSTSNEVIENRKHAVELAQQTKALQVQYRELVSGEPSSVLNALENAMGGGGGGSDDGENEQGDDVLN